MTDPEYTNKLREARQLKLSKRDFPRPLGSLPTDLVQGPTPEGSLRDRPEVKKGFDERPADTQFGKELPTVSRDEAFKRDNLGDPDKAPNKDDVWKRAQDKRNEAAGTTSHTDRDADLKPPPPEKQGQKNPDPFLRRRTSSGNRISNAAIEELQSVSRMHDYSVSAGHRSRLGLFAGCH